MEEIKLTIHPFEMDSLKEAAKKILEEAGEAFAEWVILNCADPSTGNTTRLADELADCIQALCNLAARYGIDLQAAMERCEQRNRERGRYPMEEEENAEPIGACGSRDCYCGRSRGSVPIGVGVLRKKSPEEMSAAELIETLKATCCFGEECKKILGYDWCDNFSYCYKCRYHLSDLLKAAYEREMEASIELIRDTRDEYMRLREENGIMLDELRRRQDRIDKLECRVYDLTHERDVLRRGYTELDSAGIMRLHKLLRDAMGEAKNITDAARHYIGSARESRNTYPERKAVIERLRGIEFIDDKVTLHDIGVAVMGRDPSLRSWWSETTRRELRDKLIELLS